MARVRAIDLAIGNGRASFDNIAERHFGVLGGKLHGWQGWCEAIGLIVGIVEKLKVTHGIGVFNQFLCRVFSVANTRG